MKFKTDFWKALEGKSWNTEPHIDINFYEEIFVRQALDIAMEKVVEEIEKIPDHYMSYITEEYQKDIIRKDDDGEDYIKFTVKEFREFCEYILVKSSNKAIEILRKK